MYEESSSVYCDRRLVWPLALMLCIVCLFAPHNPATHEAPAFHSHFFREVAPAAELVVDRLPPGIHAIARDIASNFNVAEDVALTITNEAYRVATLRHVKPTLVLAVAAVESRYNPEAVNKTAKGLMQILPRWHHQKVQAAGGEPALLQITPNLQVGTAILAEYLKASDGSVDAALSRYRGVSDASTYVSRVRDQMQHLARVAKKAEAKEKLVNLICR